MLVQLCRAAAVGSPAAPSRAPLQSFSRPCRTCRSSLQRGARGGQPCSRASAPPPGTPLGAPLPGWWAVRVGGAKHGTQRLVGEKALGSRWPERKAALACHGTETLGLAITV